MQIAVEQGVLGAAFFVALVGGAMWAATRAWHGKQPQSAGHPQELLLQVAAAASLAALAVHGAVEAGVYVSKAAPVLFLPIGMAYGLATMDERQRAEVERRKAWLGGPWALIRGRGYDYYAVTDRIERSVPDGARVMGMPNWWLGLAGHDYRSSLNLTFYHFVKGYSLTQGLEADRPDVIIVDDTERRLLVEQGGYNVGSGFDYYNLPRAEFKAFLAQRERKVDEFTDPWHGRFETYAINWD